MLLWGIWYITGFTDYNISAILAFLLLTVIVNGWRLCWEVAGWSILVFRVSTTSTDDSNDTLALAKYMLDCPLYLVIKESTFSWSFLLLFLLVNHAYFHGFASRITETLRTSVINCTPKVFVVFSLLHLFPCFILKGELMHSCLLHIEPLQKYHLQFLMVDLHKDY